MRDKPIRILISEYAGEVSGKQLKQTAILRHGRRNRRQLAKNVAHMRRDPFGFSSFQVFALAGEKAVGFAYFCRDEGDPAQWYYGDLVVHPRHRRKGIATAIVGEGIRAITEKNATKLFTYIHRGDDASLALHEKLSFIRCETQEPINGFLMDGRAVYERTLKLSMEEITCRAMQVEDLHVRMMDDFNRHQVITHILRKNRRVKKLRKPRVEDWPAEGKTIFVKNWFIPKVYMRQYYPGEPFVFAAFRGDQVAGFAVWDHYWGKEKEEGYAVLLRLLVSLECRRVGLGRQLFKLCAEAARAEGAKQLFISTEPALETQAFYKSMGCVAAKKRLFGPKHDIPLEFTL